MFNFISPKLKIFIKKFRKFNAIYDLDKKLLKYLNYKNGFFIELGAYNGVDQSNTFYFEKYLDWHGILIEPSKREFINLKKNRSRKNYFYKCACDFEQKKIRMINDGLMTKINLDEKNFYFDKEIIIKTETLENLLFKSNNIKKIDLLSIDVEGMELNVLKGIDLNQRAVRYILIETKDMDNISRYLKQYNYELIEKMSPGDFLYKKI